MRSLALLASVALSAWGCTSSDPVADGAGGADAAPDVASEAAPDATSDAPDAADDGVVGDAPSDAPFACGTVTCGATQVCVEPCCGGAAPPCIPRDDAGACPGGFHEVSACAGSAGPGCQGDPCTPPAPFCVDAPAGCAAGLSCGCFPANPCAASGSCGYASGRVVNCVCA